MISWSIYRHQLPYPSPDSAYRLQDCHRHLKFCPAFLICSGGTVGLGCVEGTGEPWLGWGAGGGDGVTIGCGRGQQVKRVTTTRCQFGPSAVA